MLHKTYILCIGGYGINLSEIDDLTNKTDSLSKKLLEHGVTGFCPTIISIKEGYEKVRFNITIKYVIYNGIDF